MPIEPPPGFEYAVRSWLPPRRRYAEGLNLLARTPRLDRLGVLGPRDLWRLSCRDQPVTDASLEQLTRFEGLRVLDLTRTKVTDAGMHALARLSALHHLRLNGCEITDVGLATIAVIESLDELELFGTLVTGDGLKSLTRHPNLASLDLRNTKVRGGLEPLATVPKLRQLRVSFWAERHVDVLRAAHPDLEVI